MTIVKQQAFSKSIAFSLLSFFVFVVSGCSSITKGTTQEVLIETQGVADAKCTLTNDKGIWVIENTPGYATVARGGGDMKVECAKSRYHTAEIYVLQTNEGMTTGNAIFGGLIGAAIDSASGAAYKYPSEVSVLMRPISGILNDNLSASIPNSPTPTDALPTKPSHPSGSKVETEGTTPDVLSLDENALKKYQGNWTGFEGNGCIDIGSNPASVIANAHVKGSFLQLKLDYETVWGSGTVDFRGQGTIPASRKLTFDQPFSQTNHAVITFEKRAPSISVILDTTCHIRLKRTNRQVIPANFEGRPSRVEEASLNK